VRVGLFVVLRGSGDVSIESAVEKSVKGTDPVLAAQALELARLLDDPGNSATSKSMANKELRETMAEIRALSPPKEAPDGVTDINERRAMRLAGIAASAGSPSS
jgi:hypothetical protein